MITIYKKEEKNIDNPSGIIKINDITTLNKPFLLCLSAQDNHDNSIYGIMREGASIARVFTTNEVASKYKINDFPVDFLGLRYQKDSKNRTNYEEIVEDLIYPYLVNNTNSIEDIIKRARNINFMTYCDGTETYCNIENKLISKLQSKGINDDNIKKIISQISLVAIGTMINISDIMATSVAFIDVNDSEISTNMTENYKKYIQDRNRKGIFGKLGKNIIYVYNGNGSHDLKEYFKNDNVVKPAIGGVIAYFLASREILSNNDIIERLNKYTDETKTPSMLLNELDNSLNYNTAKYTEAEIKLRQELDNICKKMYELQKDNTRLKTENAKYSSALNSVIKGIKANSSDMTFYKILVPSGIWQAPPNVDYLTAPSDRELILEKSKVK